MANFFLDNEDIQFLFDHIDLGELAAIQEDGFVHAADDPSGYAPQDAADTVDNYRRILEIMGEVCGDMIAPNAEQVDREGNTHNDDGTVTLHPLVQANLNRLTQADMMGFTLPRKYGGLNCPCLVYTMANELVSRADTSFNNLFGLQGIAETVHAFANDTIRDEILPRFSSGDVTGAMVLTEPDAGSDLQAVRLRAFQDEQGNWYLNGVKRFITNGCGEILLVLARSEPEISDGRGLSLFIAERSERVKVRHLENKLGIHGSPTCELVFDNMPCRLIGERQRGLITYVMALMNGARLGIAAQSLGVAEAAYRLARTYAHTRHQFGGPIERLPAVAELVTGMKIQIEAARALAYETARICDHENNNFRVMEMGLSADKEEEKRRKQLSRALKRINGMLTPMSKYYCSEMSNRVTYDAIQVLGGSGYMKDYAAERYARDARITTIYEGTSQLQVVAAVRGVASGSLDTWCADHETKTYGDPLLDELKQQLVEARQKVNEAVVFVKTKGTSYLDLAGRRLVDSAIAIIVGHLLLAQGAKNERKKRVARRFISQEMSVLRMNLDQIHAADMAAMEEYALLAGPVPSGGVGPICHCDSDDKDGRCLLHPRGVQLRQPGGVMNMFAGKIGLVMGVANERSIAWALSQALYAEGAELAFTHLPSPTNERRVTELVGPHQPKILMPCNVQKDDDIARVCDAVHDIYGRLDFLIHSIAFAPPQELRNPYIAMSREGWHLAMDISVYSLVAACRAAAPLMTDGGTIVTISYFGGEKVIPGYNVMGVCKAALEHSVRYLAWDLGRQKIRVNCISAGPVRTLSAAGIAGFDELRQHAVDKSPLGRNIDAADLGTTGLYLLSNLSSGVTGETIHVDCGYSIVGL